MRTDPFRSALLDLASRAEAGHDMAIMCAETLWWRCHRRLIADALVARGLVVRHLIDRPPGTLHRISAAALASLDRIDSDVPQQPTVRARLHRQGDPMNERPGGQAPTWGGKETGARDDADGSEHPVTSAATEERDRVDAQSEQSFPASDPPSWPGAAL